MVKTAFLDSDLYPKFLLRKPNEKTIWAYQGMEYLVRDFSSLQKKAIVLACYQGRNALVWIPNEEILFEDADDLPTSKDPSLEGVFEKDTPNHLEWIKMIEEVQKRFQTTFLQKVVLSRQTFINVSSCRPKALLSFLFKKTSSFKNRATIVYMPDKDHLFISMSPEKLFSANKNKVTCDIVAGTFKSEEEEVTSKELKENDYVLFDLQREFEKICTQTILVSNPRKIPSGNLIHLKRELQITFANTPDYIALASLLHPTAAICGFPREESKKAIRDLETLQRDDFAGYAGVISPDNADLFVTIRSARIERNQIVLFAGAGITIDSDPQKEWDELNLKIDPYLEILFANTTPYPFSSKLRN